MNYGESKFQEAVVKFLRLNKIFCFSVPNGTKLKITQARKAIREGLFAGVSDLIILLPKGKTIFVEIKNPNKKGKQSEKQKIFQQTVEKLDFDYLLWQKWEDVENFVKNILCQKK